MASTLYPFMLSQELCGTDIRTINHHGCIYCNDHVGTGTVINFIGSLAVQLLTCWPALVLELNNAGWIYCSIWTKILYCKHCYFSTFKMWCKVEVIYYFVNKMMKLYLLL